MNEAGEAISEIQAQDMSAFGLPGISPNHLGPRQQPLDRRDSKRMKGIDCDSVCDSVSEVYDLTSDKLSYSSIVHHKQNKTGLVIIMKVIEELLERAPRCACLRSYVFGGCAVAQCDYDHDNAPLTDEQRLQVLRRARDLILAGKASSIV